MSLISKPEIESPEERELDAYIHAVAAALGVPETETGCEVSDVTCGYVFLAEHSDDHPARDVLLTWDEHNGWQLALESGPSGCLHVVAALGGDPRPDPADVAAFVTRVTARGHGRLAARSRLN